MPVHVDALLGVALGGVDPLREEVEFAVLLLKLPASGVSDAQGITGGQGRALFRRCGLVGLCVVMHGYQAGMAPCYGHDVPN